MAILSDIFNIYSGSDLELCYLDKNEFGVNFVSRTSKNNGVSAVVSPIDIDPFPAGSISVAVGGSVLETFLQEKEYYTGYHIKVLIPKEPMDRITKLFYCTCIRMNQYKYNYGRQANTTLKDLIVPSRDELPSWLKDIELPDVSSIPDYFLDEGYDKACWYLDNIDIKVFEDNYSNKLIKSTCDIPLEGNKWSYFYLKDIFNISRGKRLKSADRFPGLVPYYSASKENNGMTDMISNPLFIERNALIFTTFGDSYYVEGEFTASDEVTILKNDFLNKYNGLFVSTILNMEKYRYSFGRKAYYEKILKVKISLPSIILESGEIIPDYIFMENYIKNLNYSQKI